MVILSKHFYNYHMGKAFLQSVNTPEQNPEAGIKFQRGMRQEVLRLKKQMLGDMGGGLPHADFMKSQKQFHLLGECSCSQVLSYLFQHFPSGFTSPFLFPTVSFVAEVNLMFILRFLKISKWRYKLHTLKCTDLKHVV